MRSACATRTATATATTPIKPTDILGALSPLRRYLITTNYSAGLELPQLPSREGSQARMASMCSVRWAQTLDDHTQRATAAVGPQLRWVCIFTGSS